MTREDTCLLCGLRSHDVAMRLVAWRDAGTSSEYEVIPRCSRTHECRERALKQGEEWPVREPLDYEVIRTRVGDPLPMPEFRRG